jgi:dephospho-CoA kinase
MTDNLRLIAIVGMPGAGKSLAADFFRSKGLPVLRFGDQTDIGLEEQGLPLIEANERKYREDLRRELGMAAMAIKIKPRIEKALEKSSTVILDGLYSWEEYVHLKEKFPSIELLCIYARPETRYSRLGHRPVRPLGRKEAEGRDISEIENLNKGGPIARADYLVINEGTEGEFRKNLEIYYSSL